MHLCTYSPTELADTLFIEISKYAVTNHLFHNSLTSAIYRNKSKENFTDKIMSFLNKRVLLPDQTEKEIKDLLNLFKEKTGE